MGSGKDTKGSAGKTGEAGAPGDAAEEKPFAVGDTVVTNAEPVTEDGKSTQEPGVIVDDFGDNLAADDADYGRSWALAKRWAIKLDDGRLVFRSSDEVSRPTG